MWSVYEIGQRLCDMFGRTCPMSGRIAGPMFL